MMHLHIMLYTYWAPLDWNRCEWDFGFFGWSIVWQRLWWNFLRRVGGSNSLHECNLVRNVFSACILNQVVYDECADRNRFIYVKNVDPKNV